MNTKDRIAQLEAQIAQLKRENMEYRYTLIRAGLSANHYRVLEQDIQRRKHETLDRS